MPARSTIEKRLQIAKEFDKILNEEQLPLEEEMRKRVNLSPEEINRIRSYEPDLKGH